MLENRRLQRTLSAGSLAGLGANGSSFSPVSELAMNMSGLSTGSQETLPPCAETPRRCVRVIHSQKTTATPKTLLFRPQAKKMGSTGTLIGFTNTGFNFESTVKKEKSPEPRKSSSTAFQRLANISFQPNPSSSCSVSHGPEPDTCSMRNFSPESISQDGLSPLPCEGATPSPSFASLPKKLSLDISPTPPPASNKPSSKPMPDDDETSQDSGVHMHQEVEFPIVPTVSRPCTLTTTVDSCFSPAFFVSSPDIAPSPHALSFSSPSPDLEDDGFHEEEYDHVPKGFERLINGPMLTSTKPKTQQLPPHEVPGFTPVRSSLPKHILVESKGSSRRGLFRSPSAPRLLTTLQQQNSQEKDKSDEDNSENTISRLGLSRVKQRSPLQWQTNDNNDVENTIRLGVSRVKRGSDGDISFPVLKRRCKVGKNSSINKENVLVKPSPRTLQRCNSECLIKSSCLIETALKRAESSGDSPMIGNFSQKYCLPLCPSKHQDLKGISPQTLADLMDGNYDDVVNKYLIVDCRYPYEFDGGHIIGAKNVYTKWDIYSKFMDGTEFKQDNNSTKRNILVFHCEFSSERGPKMSRFLRNKDRDANKECYPQLHYPEIYLLEGGYKCFWEDQKNKCTLNGAYKPMLHEDHNADLKKFRAKSKTWPLANKVSRCRLA